MKARRKAEAVKIGFEETSLRIQIKAILPLRQVSAAVRKSVKYLQIAASIAEVGIIEPPVVVRDAKARDTYHLLDGHLRLDILPSAAKVKSCVWSRPRMKRLPITSGSAASRSFRSIR